MKKMIDVAEISVSYQPVVGWDTQPKIISSEDAYLILSPVKGKYYSFAENNLLGS